MSISALVITLNEAQNIQKYMEAVRPLCDDIVVVDSGSTDGTVEMAEAMGALVIHQAFLGDGPQRAFGIPYCKHDWILNLDTDEFLDAEARAFILSKAYEQASYDAYSFRVKNFFQDKFIHFAGWYPDHKIRFFNRKSAAPSADKIHQSIQALQPKKLHCHILHYGSHSFKQIIDKKTQYAQWKAEQLYSEGKRVGPFKPLLNGWWMFMRCYFAKRGVFNGIDGLTFSLTQAYFSYMKYAMLIQIQRHGKP